ncbi:hypothetical protein ROA7450_01516 [Roseovarius albus]|uniref:Uncharacterized protein n=1 Tax=Roseovarius albus TaxID=1247867 RepID=A0A1X6YY00_9RHOB|nr:hypothetical protein ROA7450_01516 [Roseovarius albus]
MTYRQRTRFEREHRACSKAAFDASCSISQNGLTADLGGSAEFRIYPPISLELTAHSCRSLTGQDAAVAARFAVIRYGCEFRALSNSHIADISYRLSQISNVPVGFDCCR